MKAHIIQHVPFESPAAIEHWLNNNAFDIHYIRLYENFSFPSIKEVDWLVIMGGPMSVNDEAEYPWLAEEKEFVKNCIEAGKIVLGICLGAQLIASSLGRKVYAGKNKEIGWFPIQAATADNLIPNNTTVFHWHGETFDLPEGATLLASTQVCHNQIFKLGDNVIGMQCHLEMTEASIAGMVENCSHEIQTAPYIQTIEEIKNGTKMFSEEANQVLFSLLNSLKK